MPINYNNYPANWKTEIRPAILLRAKNHCENCGVENYAIVFRGFINPFNTNKKEVYQDGDGRVYDADNSRYLFRDFDIDIEPLSGNINQKAIKVVLTIAHLDHDINNNDYSNLKALCQRCHNRHDIPFRKSNRDKNKLKLFALILLFFTGSLSAQSLDKIAHFSTGATISGFSYCLTYKLTKNKNTSTIAGIGIAAILAVGKEYRDRKLYNAPMNESLKDVGFTVLGAGLAALTLRITF